MSDDRKTASDFGSDKIVWRTPNSKTGEKKVFHLDDDCRYCPSYAEKKKIEVLFEDHRACSRCSDSDIDHSTKSRFTASDVRNADSLSDVEGIGDD